MLCQSTQSRCPFSNASPEKVYATVSAGALTLLAVLKKDGKSKKKVIGLYGSAIGLLSPDLVSGNKHCLRIVNGIDEFTLQASSNEDMMEWATAIAHGISMENGGGLLLEKAKKEWPHEETVMGNFEYPTQEQSIFRSVDEESGVRSFVFSKSIMPEEGDADGIDDSFSSICLRPSKFNMPAESLNISHATEVTEADSFFRSLDPADLSATMEEFASSFFVTCKEALPFQTLRTDVAIPSMCEFIESYDEEDLPWLGIDREHSATGSDVMSDLDVFEKYSDFDGGHIGQGDFARLLRLTNSSGNMNEGKVQRIDDFDACI